MQRQTIRERNYLIMAINWKSWDGDEALKLYLETQRLLKEPQRYPETGCWVAVLGDWAHTASNLETALNLGLRPIESMDSMGCCFVPPVVAGYIRAILTRRGYVCDPINDYWSIGYEE